MPDNRYIDAFSVLEPSLLSSVHRQSSSIPQRGFPRPSEQFPSPAVATTKHYFADETKWRMILEYGDFDDIVIGTGFCALAYVDKALQLNPRRRILVLERGGLWLMSHFQNLPLPFSLLLNESSQIYPWTLTSSTLHSDIKFVHGSIPCLGGRSPFWSAWSPRPPLGLMRDFPKSLLATASEEQFWKNCKDLLNVVQQDQLYGGEYLALQNYVGEQLNRAISIDKTIDAVSYVEPANIAVGKTTGISKLTFEKFSTPGPLLKLHERQRSLAKKGEGSPLTIATDVVVERFEIDPLDPGKRANVLHTSRGSLHFSLPKKPNIILATGAIPACTIVLNSLERQHGRAGSRLTGHFVCHIKARFPLPEKYRTLRKEEWTRRKEGKDTATSFDALEIGAYYLAGRDPSTKLQYHGEITVTHSPLAEEQREDAARLCPDFFSAPTAAQLEGSNNHIIAACVMVGEIDETNSECRIRLNKERENRTTNVDIQLAFPESGKKLRDVMYNVALQAITSMASEEINNIEYWHDEGDESGRWDKLEPEITQFQIPGLVHESSTLFMDDMLPIHPNLESEEESRNLSKPSVDRNYRVYGTGNVYVTGSAIFPTSGAWNQTLTMCGFAQDLAIKLHKRSVFHQVSSLSITSNQVFYLTGATENLLNAVRKRANDTLASLNPKGLSSGQKGVWQFSWGPAIWKNGADVPNAGLDLSWYVTYHESLEFEDGSLHPTYVIVVAGAPAKTFHQLADFNAYVSDGQFKSQPAEASPFAIQINKPYISLPIARAVHTLLTSPAPSVAGVRTLLNFINVVKTTKDSMTRNPPRFIFTGHSVGGAIASTTALALVSAGVIPAERTLTYSIGAPTCGNLPFVNLFERTFRVRNGAEGYLTWNINLVNTLDVVPHAWCHQRFIAPSQNLSNIPAIYGSPMIPDVIKTTDVLINNVGYSGVVFKPLPSRYFTGVPPSAPPATLDAFLQIAVYQHVQAYVHEAGMSVSGSDFSQQDLVMKSEADVRSNYPVIGDFERAYRNGLGAGGGGSSSGDGYDPSNGTWTGTRASPTRSVPGNESWIMVRAEMTGNGIGNNAGSRANSGDGTGIIPDVDQTRSGPGPAPQNGSGSRSGSETGAGPGVGAASPTGTKNGSTGNGADARIESGRVAVTPLSSLTVLKYGNPEYNLIPQSVQNHPVLVYRGCFPESASVSELKAHLVSVGVVEPHRTGTLLIRDHFHTTTHKVLCVVTGLAQLRFGGEGNPDRVDVDVKRGDVIIVPAGVPHRLLKDISRDLEVLESYPKGVKVDADSRRLGSRPQQSHLYFVASLAWFSRDPVYGDQGPVIGC